MPEEFCRDFCLVELVLFSSSAPFKLASGDRGDVCGGFSAIFKEIWHGLTVTSLPPFLKL